MFSPMLLWEENKVYAENANNEASNCWYTWHTHADKMPAETTHYFDSFSNIVFVSSSVRGLILASLWNCFYVWVRFCEAWGTTWVEAESDAQNAGRYVTSQACPVPAFFAFFSRSADRSFVRSRPTSQYPFGKFIYLKLSKIHITIQQNIKKRVFVMLCLCF